MTTALVIDENMRKLLVGRYVVWTQAGFNKAISDHAGTNKADRWEVKGYPVVYPSVVTFISEYAGYHFYKASCVPLKDAIGHVKAYLQDLMSFDTGHRKLVDDLKLPSFEGATRPPEFMDYFSDSVDYPDNMSADPLPIGTSYHYVSSTFLNGFINYVNIQKAFVINRYHDWDEDISDQEHEVWVRRTSKGFYTDPERVEVKTKRQVLDLVHNRLLIHARLSDFRDDVLILAKAKGQDTSETPIWFFFWYDQDCSDCSIGRFVTDDSDDQVKHLFTTYARTNNMVRTYPNSEPAYEIPFRYFSDWITG